MSVKPLIAVDYVASPGDDFRLYKGLPHPFLNLMAHLYPGFSSYTKFNKPGYLAFTGDGVFIGAMLSTGYTSVRKNPFLLDTEQLFLRALLAVFHHEKLTASSMFCELGNYGTLRLMQKLGQGAKLDAKGGHRSTVATPESVAYLNRAVELARPEYADRREYAKRKAATLDPQEIAALLPTEDKYAPLVASYNVSLT